MSEAFIPIRGLEWNYRVEGGRHLVFEYVGDVARLQGKILRVCLLKESNNGKVLPMCEEALALQALGSTKLAPFLVKTADVMLSPASLLTLVTKAELKRHSSIAQTTCLPQAKACAFLQDDLARFFGESTTCVEVKPKCAVVARSRLIPPDFCRVLRKYTLVDTLLRNFSFAEIDKAQTRGELFNPADILSGEQYRIAYALEILRATKSHWLRIMSPSGKFLAATGIVQRPDGYDDPHCIRAVRLSSLALAKSSSCLTALKEIQSLDYLDKLGLGAVWKRLVYLTGEDEDEAGRQVWEHYLQAKSLSVVSDGETYESWKTSVSYESPCQALLEHDEAKYCEAMKKVSSMPAEVCARMVADSLMAGMAKDCSIMVSLSPLPSVQIEGLDGAGTITDPEDGVQWQFKVHVIDVGPKSLSKIRTWMKLDHRLFRQHLN